MAREKVAAKQRIFTAAASLFAQKGYAAVSVRQIANKAKVNIAMINYYYGGKMGILKAIVNECYEKYYTAIEVMADEGMSPEERVRIAIRNIIDFYRNNREPAMVAFNTIPIDIPEILDLKLKWITAKHKGAVDFFGKLGLDLTDMVTGSVIRGVLTTLIGDHFQSRYIWEHILKSPEQAQYVKEHMKTVPTLQYGDTFYKRYSEILATLYFDGVHGIVQKYHKEKRGGKHE